MRKVRNRKICHNAESILKNHSLYLLLFFKSNLRFKNINISHYSSYLWMIFCYSTIYNDSKMYIPDNSKYIDLYPSDTASHYLRVNTYRGFIFDDKYPYIDKSRSFKIKRFFVRILLYTIIFPLLTHIRMGLKIKGKHHLKTYKEELKDGAVSVSNHIHLWDYIAVMKALRPKNTYVLVWDKNINGKDGPSIRLVGGIPIPTLSKGVPIYNKALKEILSNKKILHVYAEGSMWEYYVPIRPFKTGAASIAISNNKPILPIGFSYHKPGFIEKHLFRLKSCITINIGKPIFKDDRLSRREAEIDLTRRAFVAVNRLVGISKPKYEPIYNNSKRID